jgi:hypothetical protein
VLREAWYALGFHLRIALGLEPPCAKHFPAAWPLVFEPGVDLLVLPVVALALFGARIAGPQRRRAYVAGLAWAALSYLPSSGLIPLTRYLADSYLYLPLAGAGLALAAVVDSLAARSAWLTTRFVPVASVALALALAVVTHRASSHWENDVALWGYAYARYPNDYRLCRNLGNAHIAQGHPQQALDLYESCATKLARAPFRKNIAIALFLVGRKDDARNAFFELERESPGDRTIEKYLRALGTPE